MGYDRPVSLEKNMVEKLEKYNKEKARIIEGDIEAIKRQHEKGRLTARERMNKLFDGGTFEEFTSFQRSGVFAAYGEVNGRPVTAFAQDVTEGADVFKTGDVLTRERGKMESAVEDAATKRTPLVGIFDSPGENAEEAVQSLDFFSTANMARILTHVSGVIPKIALVMGECSGEQSVLCGLSDFTFMVRNTSYMHLAPPPPGMTGKEFGDPWNVHARVTGCCDYLAENDEDCLQKCRQFLSFLPSHNMEMPPVVDTGDDPNRRIEEFMDDKFVPIDTSKPYNVYRVFQMIVDRGEFFEIRRHWTRNLITGFARLGGHTVGLIVNNPQSKGGCMTIDAADKMNRIIRFSDAFNIPLIWFEDCPGFLPAMEEERRALIRHGAANQMANSEASVPMILLPFRKARGGGRTVIGPRADIRLSWPLLDTGMGNPRSMARMSYKSELEAITDEEKRKQREDELTALVMEKSDMQAALGFDNIIDPRETRPYLINALNYLRDKQLIRQTRKHENIRL